MIGRNHGMRQSQHGPRLEHFGGNFARKARDVLAGDATDYTGRSHRHYEERFADEAVLYDSSGKGYAEEPRYSLFDEMMALPVRETRCKTRANAKGNCEYMRNDIHSPFPQRFLLVPDVANAIPALDAVTDASDELSDILSHIDSELMDGDIEWTEQDSSEDSGSSSKDFSGDSDSMDDYDDCWDAYEEDDREWIDLVEEDAEFYYDDDGPLAVT